MSESNANKTDARVVAALLDPSFYPHPVERVDLIQTHISYIFLAGDLVYKVKKPVAFGFLDFTTLNARRHFCLEELRLNRRLAPDVYLHVVPIEAVAGEEEGGSVQLGRPLPHEPARPIEYALVMKRLPEERMLKSLLSKGEVDPAVMDAVARKVARFHEQAETGGEVDRIGGFSSVEQNAQENFEQTTRYIDLTIPRWQYDFLRAYNEWFLVRNRGLLEDRVRRGRVRDCHGDLHLEHICLAGGEDGITIFDCIEFNRRFRYGDVASEVAFLYMDLDFKGRPDLAERFINAYIKASGDEEVRLLLPYFASYRAYVRGKVTSFRLDDPAMTPAERENARTIAERYFSLAYSYAARLDRPTLLLVGGLMGTGKTTLANAIAPVLGAEVIRTDVVRKRLAGIAETERRFEEFGQGLYSPGMTELTYQAALTEAEEILRRGGSVIIDASWARRTHRLQAARLAEQLGIEVVFVECRCPEDVIRGRLEQRVAMGTDASDGRWEIFALQRDSWEQVEAEPFRVVMADCAKDPDLCAREVIREVRLSG